MSHIEVTPIWSCKVGVIGPLEVPQGGDAPMRDAVERAFRRTIGVAPEFTFSGWSAELTEGELAAVEDRLPDRSKVTREVPYDVTDEMVQDAWVVLHDGLPSGCSQTLVRQALEAALEGVRA